MQLIHVQVYVRSTVASVHKHFHSFNEALFPGHTQIFVATTKIWHGPGNKALTA